MALSLAADKETGPVKKTKWYRQLYFWVIVAIVLGVLVGWLWPGFGTAMEPVGTTFVTAMRMLIGPIVFLTIVAGIASVANIKQVGSTGIKALVYFQCGTLLAMATGLIAINLIPLGNGVNADASTIETSDAVNALIEKGEDQQWWQFLTHIVPSSMIEPFVEGDILQIIFLAVISGVALNAVGRIGAPLLDLVQRSTKVIFKILSYIMKLAPLGAFGAMAYAIGKYGVSTLTSLGGLIALFYLTSAFFVLVVLGSVMGYLKLNIFKLLRYLKEELLLIVGTSTAEPALPGLMRKMEHAGAKKSVVGLVVPTGYSFNLDGAAIYLSLAAVYIAQATNSNLTITQQIGLMAIMLLTSKGAAGVAGGGFIALAATLSTVGTIPAAGIMLIFGIDKFMVRMPRPGQLHRQLRRHPVRRQMGQGPGRRPGPQGPEQGRRAGPARRDRRHREPAIHRKHEAGRRLHRRLPPPRTRAPNPSTPSTPPLRNSPRRKPLASQRSGHRGNHRPTRQRQRGQQRPAPRQRRAEHPSRKGSSLASSSAGGPVAGPPAGCPPTQCPSKNTHPPSPPTKKRQGHEGSPGTGQVQGQPHRRRGGPAPGQRAHRTRDPIHRAAARRRRRRQRPGRHRVRVPPHPHHRRRGHRPRAPHHRRVRRHHRRHRGRQHLRPAHPARRETRPAGSHQQGVGQAIVSLLRRNPSRIVLALGGSASTDGGTGLLAALGAVFRDDHGQALTMNGGSTAPDPIDRHSPHLTDLSGVEIIIASDVQNPLTGPDGAAAVYGPQKGATADLVRDLDAGLDNLVHQLTAGRKRATRHAWPPPPEPVPPAGSASPGCSSAAASSPAPTTSSTC